MVEPTFTTYQRFPTRLLAAANKERRARDTVSLAAVWHEAFGLISSNSALILTCAFLGFALAGILSSLLGATMLLDVYQRTRTLMMTYGPTRTIPLVVEAIVGTITGVCARTVITWLVLQRDHNAAGLRMALRANLTSLPFLFVVMLGLSGLLYAGNVGMSDLLNTLQLDLAEGGRLSLTLDGMGRSIILRTISIFIPDPGAPFSQLLTYVRLESTRTSTNLVYAGGLSFFRVKTIQEVPLPWLVGGASMLLLVVIDTLFRYGIAAVILEPQQNRWQAFVDALRLAGRNFGLVLAHIWVVRLAIFVLSTLFVTIPLVLVQSTLIPLVMRSLGSAWPFLISNILFVTSVSLVSMVFAAFSVVYDTCLYRRLILL